MPAHIVVMDSEELIRRFLQRALSAAGYTVETADSPENAMKICRDQSIGLVLADCGFLRPNGHDLAWWIALERPQTRVLLMAAWETECQKCPYNSGCGVIRKPFHINEVLAAVAQVLSPPA